jgi:putative Holliday junction resolvase
MRYLGIDFGSKRVGLSISDEAGEFAFPFSVFENTETLVQDLVVVCKENKIGAIVVGDSKDFAQKENEIMKKIKPFTEKIKVATNLPIYMHPEFLTSMEAERLQGHNEMHDASASAIILKSFLDTQKNNDRQK